MEDGENVRSRRILDDDRWHEAMHFTAILRWNLIFTVERKILRGHKILDGFLVSRRMITRISFP